MSDVVLGVTYLSLAESFTKVLVGVKQKEGSQCVAPTIQFVFHSRSQSLS